MAADPILALEARQLTQVVNRRERPRRALTTMLFPDSTHQNLLTETVQVDELTGSDEMAPFITKDGEAVAVGSDNGRSYTFETPMISVKRPLSASKLLFERMAGMTQVFAQDGTDVAGEAILKLIADDVAKMERTVNKREEWMIAQALTGIIAYTNEDTGSSFTIDLRKPSGNTFAAPGGYWTIAAPSVLHDIKVVQRVLNDNEVGQATDAVGDVTAADALDNLLEAKKVMLDTNYNVSAGEATLIANYEANGMRYIGKIGGVRFWEYNAKYPADGTGTMTSFIREGYFEFFSTSAEAEAMRRMFYGRIPDLDAMMEGSSVTRRYSKSELKKEPSVYIAYLKSRPLPWLYRADANVSLIVAV